MHTDSDLKERIERIEGMGYKAYKGLEGEYQFPRFLLFIDHVQGDPFAAPSRVRVRIGRKDAGFPDDILAGKSRNVGACDFLTRRFYTNCRKIARGNRGIGQSGLIIIDVPVQEVLERSAMLLNHDFVEARFFMGLPARGRRISGKDAKEMFLSELPQIVARSLEFANLDQERFYHHVLLNEDADCLRSLLGSRGLVAFVADGAVLPRASGIDPAPLTGEAVVPFRSPESLRVGFDLPNRGTVTGMGIPAGVTLIVGGGFHGKSTLLNALELGIYNHLPGDGRELVVAAGDAVKIRAADGRNIAGTDISPFINNLPFGKDTAAFSTGNASGSTSQAANIVEAVEAGARLLLLDEDTSATNFMIRDRRMQALVAKEKEPITPFIDKVRQLFGEKGVSTVLVMGGSGDYFSVADLVIQMTDYLPCDVTAEARAVAAELVTGRANEGGDAFGELKKRVVLKESVNPLRGRRVKIGAPRLREILFGTGTIDLDDVEQIISISQTRALGYAIHFARQFMDGRRTLAAVAAEVLKTIDSRGIDILTPYIIGDLARFRSFELAAALNRMRTLSIRQQPD